MFTTHFSFVVEVKVISVFLSSRGNSSCNGKFVRFLIIINNLADWNELVTFAPLFNLLTKRLGTWSLDIIKVFHVVKVKEVLDLPKRHKMIYTLWLYINMIYTLFTDRHEDLKFWRWLSSGILRRVVWQKCTDVSEVIIGSIIRAIALMMEAVNTSEIRQTYTRLHGSTSQKTVVLILAAVRTWNFTSNPFVVAVAMKSWLISGVE
jgi:hypothetical protein